MTVRTPARMHGAPVVPQEVAGRAHARTPSSMSGVMDRSVATDSLEYPSPVVDRREELAGSRGGTQSVCASIS